MKIAKKIIFLCTGNSCRSQMAEGFARFFSKKRLANNIVQSAGTKADGLNPIAVYVMKELNIDISHQKSKTIDSININQFDLVVTVCDDAYCVLINLNQLELTSQVVHKSFTDPTKIKGSKEEQLLIYRQVRDEIKDMVLDLISNYE